MQNNGPVGCLEALCAIVVHTVWVQASFGLYFATMGFEVSLSLSFHLLPRHFQKSRKSSALELPSNLGKRSNSSVIAGFTSWMPNKSRD